MFAIGDKIIFDELESKCSLVYSTIRCCTTEDNSCETCKTYYKTNECPKNVVDNIRANAKLLKVILENI